VLVHLSQGSTDIDCRFSGVTGATLAPSTLSDLVVGNTNQNQVRVLVAELAEEVAIAGAFHIDIVAANAGLSTIDFAQP
jgi:hypothetical protein